MSAWQFRLKVLPVAGLLAFHGKIPAAVDVVRFTSTRPVAEIEEHLDRVPDYWSKVEHTGDVVDRFARLLPEATSWDANARMFGEGGEDFIEIWKNDQNLLVRISIAFSLRQPNERLIREALETTRGAKCMLHDIQGTDVFEPTIQNFIARARACSAARFLPDELPLEELL